VDRTLLEYAIGADGLYVDANAELLAVTGYTLEELRGLAVGQLSTSSPDAAREGWSRYLRGEITPRPVPVLVRRKDGRLFDAIFLELRRQDDADRWRVTLELVRMPEERPARAAITTTLADWRAAERELLSLPEDDPLRPVVEAQVAELRGRYRELQAERQPGTVR
jgi:PAS domain S-box-containing protein